MIAAAAFLCICERTEEPSVVHQYQLNGYNIVLDSCSGSIHAVDEVAYDIIALYDKHTPEEIVRLICDKYAGR